MRNLKDLFILSNGWDIPKMCFKSAEWLLKASCQKMSWWNVVMCLTKHSEIWKLEWALQLIQLFCLLQLISRKSPVSKMSYSCTVPTKGITKEYYPFSNSALVSYLLNFYMGVFVHHFTIFSNLLTIWWSWILSAVISMIKHDKLLSSIPLHVNCQSTPIKWLFFCLIKPPYKCHNTKMRLDDFLLLVREWTDSHYILLLHETHKCNILLISCAQLDINSL